MGQTEPNSQFFSQIFADFCRFSLFPGIIAFQRQKTAGNRRKPQIFAETSLSHLVCPFNSALFRAIFSLKEAIDFGSVRLYPEKRLNRAKGCACRSLQFKTLACRTFWVGALKHACQKHGFGKPCTAFMKTTIAPLCEPGEVGVRVGGASLSGGRGGFLLGELGGISLRNIPHYIGATFEKRSSSHTIDTEAKRNNMISELITFRITKAKAKV